VREYIAAHVKVILIGHSIGCHIALQLLNRDDQFSSQVVQVLMLFPTIMEMSTSPNGKWFTSSLLRPFHWLSPSILGLLDYAPSVRSWLVRAYAVYRQISAECIQKGIMTLLHRDVVQKVLLMAHAEMEEVTELDVPTLEQNLERLYFYFGATDDWCPLEFVNVMTTQVPGLKHDICTEGIRHAFVIEKSKRMASILIPQVSTILRNENSNI